MTILKFIKTIRPRSLLVRHDAETVMAYDAWGASMADSPNRRGHDS
jgi:hypothetical protein